MFSIKKEKEKKKHLQEPVFFPTFKLMVMNQNLRMSQV